MKTGIAAAALLLSVVSEASAQVVVSRAWSSAPAVGGPVYESSAYVPPYSYYVTYPWPARGYVPYGLNDGFPFYGRPYGHAYDRWTWYHMGGGSSRYLARYYYPPIP